MRVRHAVQLAIHTAQLGIDLQSPNKASLAAAEQTCAALVPPGALTDTLLWTETAVNAYLSCAYRDVYSILPVTTHRCDFA